MSHWRWISKQALLLLHAESLAEHGGGQGLRDDGLLNSALARPLNLAAYGEPDIAALAAAYGWGIARNHPFIDGNKRTGFVVGILFLELNGYTFTASEADAAQAVLALAAGTLDEAGYARFLRANSQDAAAH